jgi:hypothetical protein
MRYQALRETNVPRHLGIPHPESYCLQALIIKKHWEEIKLHNQKPTNEVSRIFVHKVGNGRIFTMGSYNGTSKYSLEETEMSWLTGVSFVVKADISTCFPSIYTHSLPWALHGREVGKDNHGVELSGNMLDQCTQNLRDGQTNGLLIGPHSSNILSEIILTDIDCTLLDKGYKKLKRYIDDYVFYADSYAQAEKFIHALSLTLRNYELTLNEKKTKISPLPGPTVERWIRELKRFSFPKDEDLKFSVIRSFLDLALELATHGGTSATLNYAIKMIPNRLNTRAKRLYVQDAINLTLAFPYLAPLLEEYVFKRYWHDGIQLKISEFSNHLIRLGIQKIYPDAIAHGLYYSLTYNISLELEEREFQEILEISDCLVIVLLLEYAKKNNRSNLQIAVQKLSDELKTKGKREQDKYWLLIYQTWTVDDLTGNGQPFLSKLKASNFNFICSSTFEAPDFMNKSDSKSLSELTHD